MARRPPSSPPHIPGFESIRLLGSGGFADVFLYQQTHPRRAVAVKVLLKERMAASTIAGFTEEANMMAQFANHPSIVAVYQAGVADDGRPYLVMEFCSKPNLQVRHRAERFGEAETLRIGVQIAAALETTHRAGILHRDIKPANILVTEYGRPKLTDFGISAVGGQELVGMSIPWSPPESLTVPPTGTAASDVYSLAATLYTLLVNRAPFDVVGGANGEIDVISRIHASPVPTIGRHDVSEALETVLRRAMAKRPEERYASALEFARALQRVQIGHGMQPTPIDVVEEELAAPQHDEGEEETRFRGIVRIDAQTAPGGSAAGATRPVGPNAPAASPGPIAPTGYAAPTAPSVQAFAAPVGTAPLSATDATIARPRDAAVSGIALGAPAGPTMPVAGVPALPGGSTVLGAIPPTLASLAPPAAPVVDETVVRTPVAQPEPEQPAVETPPRRRGLRVGILVGTVALLAAAVTVALVLAPHGTGSPTASSSPDPVEVGGDPAAVTALTGAVNGGDVVFTWTDPDPKPGDSYRWRPVVAGEESTFQKTTEPTVTVPAAAAGRTCIEVLLVRKSGASAADGVQGCAP